LLRFIKFAVVTGLLVYAGKALSGKQDLKPGQKKEVEKVSYKSPKQIDMEMYPVRFNGDLCHLIDPDYSVKMENKPEGIIVINCKEYNFSLDKLAYFRNETEPFGFGLTLTRDGKTTKMFCHRGRSKVHSWYVDEVRFEDSHDAEQMVKIVKSLRENSCHIENRMNIEFASDYALMPVPYENKVKDNNSRESWMEAFAILGKVSSDMKEITKPAVEGMTGAYNEITKEMKK